MHDDIDPVNDLSRDEERKLIVDGKHIAVTYILKTKVGYDYLATEFPTGTDVNGYTTDDVAKPADSLVYYIDPENEELKVASPSYLPQTQRGFTASGK